MSKTHVVLIAQPSRYINFLKNLLEKEGYRVNLFDQGLKALSSSPQWVKHDTDRPKIFLVEHPLTDMGGGDFAVRLRDEKVFLKVPILLLVDEHLKNAETLSKQFGCQGIIQKNSPHEPTLLEIASWLADAPKGKTQASNDELAILLKQAVARPTIKSPGKITSQLDVPQVLGALSRKKLSGTLTLEGEKMQKTLWLENGQLFFAQSNQAIDRLGNFIEKKGYASRESIENALVLGANPDLRMGEILVETQTISFEQLTEVVQEQIKSIVFSTFAWSKGEFVFRPFKDIEKEPIRLQIDFPLLLKEGIYTGVDEDHILAIFNKGHAQLLPHPDLQQKLSAIALLPEEIQVSHLFRDFHLQVLNLTELSDLPVLETLQFFYFIYCMGYCEILKTK